MSHDYPQLALDDLVRLLSPSPAPRTPQDDSDLPLRIKSPSPEPLPQSDIVQMRKKVTEMFHIDNPDAQLTPREKELAKMVLRLTAVVRPDSDQLIKQADLISALTQQRDLLLNQAEEQHLRWNSEKDGWARMAEALLAQQAKNNRPSSERDEDYERLQFVETENKNLRQRLTETQSRLQMLESELTRLRPLLLMQPLISRSSMLPPTPNPKTHRARRRKKDAAATEDEEHGASEDEPLTDLLETPSQASHSQATPRAKSRKSEAPNNVHPPATAHRRRPSQKAVSRGLSADARAEHLLLAARRIGKQRAGIMSGMVHRLEEVGRERRREESATTAVGSTPKTPKRTMTHVAYPPEGYVYVNGQLRPGPGMQPVPLFFPAYPHHHILQTPSSSTTAPSATSSTQKRRQDAGTNNPQTPLDSLLSAARSMMHEDIDPEVDEDEEADVLGDSPGRTTGAHNKRTRDTFGSPIPKRRKLMSRTDNLTASHELTDRVTDRANASAVNTSGLTNVSAGRVRSALDVLADQAAAFSTQEPSAPLPQIRGKGKERAGVPSQELSSSTPRSRKRSKSRKKEVEMDTPSSAASRSGTPRSELGDNPAGSTPTEAIVDPGGGTSISNQPSSQTLDSTLASDQMTHNEAQSPRMPATSLHMDDSDVTPRQGPRVPSEDGTRAGVPQPNFVPPAPAPPTLDNALREASLEPRHSETMTPTGGENGANSNLGSTTSTAQPKNKELARVAEQDVSVSKPPAKRQRSPYVKWSKEEDDLLAQAVAKHGQKWDLVQKALPSRGYHQVRQRWLRKLGVFDSKPDLSSFQTAATTFSSTPHGEGVEPRGNPKLGLAPLSSERAFSGLVGKSSSTMPS